MNRLTEKQRRFCDEYLITLNATAAYKAAGYSARNDSVAAVEGCKLLLSPKVQEYLKQRMESKDRERIAGQDEVLECLTDIMRGQRATEEIVIEGTGKGRSKARRMERMPNGREVLKAAELLAKRYDLFAGRQKEDDARMEDDGFIDALSESVADAWADYEEPEEEKEAAEPEKEEPQKQEPVTRRSEHPEAMSTRELRVYAESTGLKGCKGLMRNEILQLIRERE